MGDDPVMQKLVPKVIESTLKIAVDPILAPTEVNLKKQTHQAISLQMKTKSNQLTYSNPT